MSRALLPALALAGLALAACDEAPDAPTIMVESVEDLHEYLLDPGGRPIYLFSTDTPADGDQPPVITCSEECQTIRPLVATDRPPIAGEGVDASRLAWYEDGPVPGLVTYDGWPLYTFETDDPDAEPHGHGVTAYGGQWLLMGADTETLPYGE